MSDNIDFLKSCEREIVKIRELTLKDDEYTGSLLGDAVGSPVGITLCVEARMKQIADLQAALAAARLWEAGLRKALEHVEPIIGILPSDSRWDTQVVILAEVKAVLAATESDEPQLIDVDEVYIEKPLKPDDDDYELGFST